MGYTGDMARESIEKSRISAQNGPIEGKESAACIHESSCSNGIRVSVPCKASSVRSGC